MGLEMLSVINPEEINPKVAKFVSYKTVLPDVGEIDYQSSKGTDLLRADFPVLDKMDDVTFDLLETQSGYEVFNKKFETIIGNLSRLAQTNQADLSVILRRYEEVYDQITKYKDGDGLFHQSSVENMRKLVACECFKYSLLLGRQDLSDAWGKLMMCTPKTLQDYRSVCDYPQIELNQHIIDDISERVYTRIINQPDSVSDIEKEYFYNNKRYFKEDGRNIIYDAILKRSGLYNLKSELLLLGLEGRRLDVTEAGDFAANFEKTILQYADVIEANHNLAPKLYDVMMAIRFPSNDKKSQFKQYESIVNNSYEYSLEGRFINHDVVSEYIYYKLYELGDDSSRPKLEKWFKYFSYKIEISPVDRMTLIEGLRSK